MREVEEDFNSKRAYYRPVADAAASLTRSIFDLAVLSPAYAAPFPRLIRATVGAIGEAIANKSVTSSTPAGAVQPPPPAALAKAAETSRAPPRDVLFSELIHHKSQKSLFSKGRLPPPFPASQHVGDLSEGGGEDAAASRAGKFVLQVELERMIACVVRALTAIGCSLLSPSEMQAFLFASVVALSTPSPHEFLNAFSAREEITSEPQTDDTSRIDLLSELLTPLLDDDFDAIAASVSAAWPFLRAAAAEPDLLTRAIEDPALKISLTPRSLTRVVLARVGAPHALARAIASWTLLHHPNAPLHVRATVAAAAGVRLREDAADAEALRLKDLFVGSSCATPIVIVGASNEGTPPPILARFADALGAQLIAADAATLTVDDILYELDAALKIGRWLALRRTQPPHFAAIARFFSERIVGDAPVPPHPEFRLWLFADRPDDIRPRAIRNLSIGMRVHTPVDVPAAMADAADGLARVDGAGDLWRSSALTRRLVLSLCILHSSLTVRAGYGVACWRSPLEIGRPLFDSALAAIVALAPALGGLNDADAAARVAEAVKGVYFELTSDATDRAVVSSEVQSVFKRDVKSFLDLSRLTPREGESPTAALKAFISSSFNISEDATFVGVGASLQRARELHKSEETLSLLHKILRSDPSLRAPSARPQVDAAWEDCRNVKAHLSAQALRSFENRGALTYAQSPAHPLDVVVRSEVTLYGAIMRRIAADVDAIIAAVQRLEMDAIPPELREVAASLRAREVPPRWREAVPTALNTSLGEFLLALEERIQYFYEWVESQEPVSMWLSAFNFPSALLNALLRVYAIRHPNDAAPTRFVHMVVPDDVATAAPADGAYIRGLFLANGQWDPLHRMIVEPPPHHLFTRFPIVHFLPDRGAPPPQGGAVKSFRRGKSIVMFGCSLYHNGDLMADVFERRPDKLEWNELANISLPAFKSAEFLRKNGVALFVNAPARYVVPSHSVR